MKRFTPVLALAVLLSGCTMVTIEGLEGSTVWITQAPKNTTDIKDALNTFTELANLPKVDQVEGANESNQVEAENQDTNNDTDSTGDSDTDTTEQTRVTMSPEKESGKWFSWLPQTGAKYSSPLVISWPECDYILTVPDASVNHGADGNASNFNQSYYFSGNPETQKDTNMSCEGGCASIFANPSCEKATYALLNQAN